MSDADTERVTLDQYRPVLSMALTVAKGIVGRGEPLEPNTAAACLAGLEMALAERDRLRAAVDNVRAICDASDTAQGSFLQGVLKTSAVRRALDEALGGDRE